ncbi:jg7833 [Pararge aegeria aegeria]|uniref:Jg7833 protein n=1 Tax=Pararge aegeria aegeria TaxID=348720 RepID=A0A8S4RKR2_9NEOP|nr:jg7833 [Pararge aegeria aegeria]
MSVRDKWVRRFSIDETAKHKNGFTIYKITSVLFPLESPEAVTACISAAHSQSLAKSSYFKRFHEEVIQERAKTIKALMEFVAEHRLLFTSTDFVNFLQTGYPEPEPAGGVINAIRSSLHLPIEDSPPLEYQTSDDEARMPSADSDPQRRALIKDKTNKYLAYAEAIYKNHLCNADQTVIQKIPNNLTEFDNYFQQRTDETRQPILPTFIPYMVPLHAYVETNNLLFLILDYAPGGKLFDYIKNYAKSVPDTPARGLNLENVFAEPKNKNDNESVDVTDANVNIETRIAVKLGDSENKFDNKIKIDDTDTVNIDRLDIGDSNKNDSITKLDNTENVIDSRVAIDVLDDVNENLGTTDRLDDMDVSELVINSQKLLLNVDKALTDVPRLSKTEEDGDIGGVGEEQGAAMGKEAGGSDKTVAIPSQVTRGVLPPSRVCLWGAQILTALESLHNAGVICR